jgi:queuosine precursor transporter
MLKAYLAMIIIVAASNYLVQFPINDWLTYGAFPYPAAYLVTEVMNRKYGPRTARQVVFVGFIASAVLSAWLATPKIALASVTAFLTSQLLDIFLFNRLRNSVWWLAPLAASLLASIVDTIIFWNMAFWGEPVPLRTWAIGDFSVKFCLDFCMIIPYRLITAKNSLSTSA